MAVGKRFIYKCSKGHGNAAPRQLTQCQCYVHGIRCEGTLAPAKSL